MPTAPSPPPEPRASATEENKRRCPGNDWGVPRPSFAWAGSAARKLAQHEVLGTTPNEPNSPVGATEPAADFRRSSGRPLGGRSDSGRVPPVPVAFPNDDEGVPPVPRLWGPGMETTWGIGE